MTQRKYAETIIIERPIANIFSIYEQVDSWPLWDHDITAAGLSGKFATGATGWIKPVGSPRLSTRLIKVDRPRHWIAESTLPLVRLRFSHDLKALSATRTEVTHALDIVGAGAGLFAFMAGRKIAAGMPGIMQSLKQFAENTPA